jgi:preprotein translocase subunit SecG
MERFLTLKYYFSPLPDPNFQFTKLTLAIGILMILGGLVAGYLRKKKLKDPIAKKILKPYPGKLLIYGLLLLFLLGVREQGIPYLSMRIWWFVLLGFFLYTFIRLPLTYRKNYGKRSQKMNQNAKKKKYLPKKKK